MPDNKLGLLLKDATTLAGETVNIGITGNRITFIGTDAPASANTLDCNRLLVSLPIANAHTHSAMTLFRGWGDNLPLMEWLEKRIWPAEARMSFDDVYRGSLLACVEMLRSGTLFFNDMYWRPRATVKATLEMGLRATICSALIDIFDPESAKRQIDEVEKLYEESKSFPDNIRFALGPHAPYTVSEKTLQWCAEFSEKHDVPVHIHLSETRQEVENIKKAHGLTPVEYLARIGLLTPRLYAAHCVWMTDSEIELLAEHDVKVLHLPVSNMKLAVGREFLSKRFADAGVTVCLGTDGAASNNNLDMFEEMKVSTILQKSRENNPLAANAAETFNSVTSVAGKTFGLGWGELEPGAPADLIFIDRDSPALVPAHDIVSNLVYSANGSCVRGAICAGRVLMWNGIIEGEREIIDKAREAAERVCG